MKTHTIELDFGYTETDDKKKVTHKKVTFGKRLTLQDFINLESHPQAKNPTQYSDLIFAQMITEFGTMKTPIALQVLLNLYKKDRLAISAAAAEFLTISRPKQIEIVFADEHQVNLQFGIKVGDVVYDVVKFGNPIKGVDEVAADAFGEGLAKEAYLIGKQISELSTADGKLKLERTVSLDDMKKLDSEDYTNLRTGAEMFTQFFRPEGT